MAHEAGVGIVSDVVKAARARWKRCEEAEQAQRARIVEDKKFRAGDQWPDAIKLQRQGASAIQGVAAQPARPCLTIDRLSQPVRQISNQIKSANFAIDVLPNGNGSDVETADVFKGLLRRIQNQSRGESPIEWAADGAIEGGIGWFRLRTDYVFGNAEGIDGPELFDQEIRIERIVNNLTVYCDPAATKPTRSDARFMFVTEDVPTDEYKRRYPKTKLSSLDFETTGDQEGWIELDQVRIAEYWRIEDAEETAYVLADGTIQVGGEAPDKPLKVRKIPTPRVLCSIINGVEVIDEYEWVGSHIPLIPVLGEELNIDGKVVLRGLISEGKDAQRMVNYTYSGAIETVALANKAPVVVAEGQLEGYEALWQTANTVNHSYLPYKPVALNGSPVPPPQRDQPEPAIQAMVLMLAKSEEAIKATTGIYSTGLGDSTSKAVSGRAKVAEIQQSDLGSSNYGDNVRRALIYAGEQMVEVLPKITRPGQILTILGADDEPEEVVVGMPFEQKDGRAVPKPEMTPEQVAAQKEQQQLQQGIAKFYDLKRGTYSVAVSVGKSFTTRREEGAAALGDLIPHLPPMMAAAVTPDFIEQLSFPGAHKIAETARRALPPELRPQEDGPDPQVMAQQLAQSGQMIQMLTAKVQEMQQAIDTEQVKSQASLMDTQMKEQAETVRAAAKLETEKETNALNNLVKLVLAEIAAESATASQHTEMTMAQLGYQHEHGMAMAQSAVGAEEAERGRQHERGEAERGRAAESMQADESRAFEAEQAEAARQAEAERAASEGADA